MDEFSERDAEEYDCYGDQGQSQSPGHRAWEEEEGRVDSRNPGRGGVYALLWPLERELPLDAVLLENRLLQDQGMIREVRAQGRSVVLCAQDSGLGVLSSS